MPDTQGRDLTARKWEAVSQLLEETLARPESERDAFLRERCGCDRGVIEEVASLAAAHEAARRDGLFGGNSGGTADSGGLGRIGGIAGIGGLDSFGDIDDPLVGAEGFTTSDDTDITRASSGGDGHLGIAGQRIGPYALVREIGRGGMGVVYLARRVDGQYDRDVALKLLRTAAYDARRRERFLAERQFLAMLSHPHIARMFDGGVTTAGQPFFTMEYIDGVRLDRYCDGQNASVAERIRLFMQVCDAVSAAHRSLVVHRDIKPNNVLVMRDGTTKLLDFGIATLLESPDGRSDHNHDHGHESDTRAHAQARTGADAGRHSHLRLCTPAYASPEQLRGGAVTAASDVYSLGAVLYELLTGVKPHHDPAVDGPRTPRPLSGDLEAIVRKAMEPQPARRYASADLLREDLEHHLQDRPVSAHAGGVLYRARKFVTRHRVAVAACVLILMSLAAGLTVALVQASRARAREAAAVAEAAMRSKYEAAMALHHKGDIAQASAFFREAVEHGRRIPHVVNTTRVDSLLQLARLLHLFERDAAGAEPLYREAMNLTRTLHPGDHVDVATAMNEYARVLLDLDRASEAEVPARAALAMWRRLDNANPSEKLGSFQMMADILARQNKDAQAEALYREALALGHKLLKAPHSHLIGLNGGLAVFLEKQRRIREAEPLRRAQLGNAVGLYTEPHPLLARAYTGMGDHHIAAGAFEDAEKAYRRAVSIRQSLHPAPHWRIAEAWSRVGYALFRQGRYQDAETMLTDSYAKIKNDKGSIPESADRARAWLVELYDAWNRPTDAARYRPAETSRGGTPKRLASAHGPR